MTRRKRSEEEKKPHLRLVTFPPHRHPDDGDDGKLIKPHLKAITHRCHLHLRRRQDRCHHDNHTHSSIFNKHPDMDDTRAGKASRWWQRLWLSRAGRPVT